MSSHARTFGAALAVAFVIVATAACQTPTPVATAPDHAAELSPAFDAYIEAWNTGNYEGLEDVFAADFRRVAPDRSLNGLDEQIEFMQEVHATYPDFRIVPGETAYLENLSFNQWTATGTVTLEDGTQTPIGVDGLTMVRYADGKITEEWVYFDSAQLTGAVGSVPHAD